MSHAVTSPFKVRGDVSKDAFYLKGYKGSIAPLAGAGIETFYR